MNANWKTLLIAGAAAIATAGAATAQLAVDEHLRKVLEAPLSSKEVLEGRAQLAELAEGETREFVLEVYPDERYTIYGACDDDCSDINLMAHTRAGDLVDDDMEDDDEPLVIIEPGESGREVCVTLSLESCEADTCIAGIAMFRSR